MKFTIIIPTFNRLEVLKYAIETVLAQDFDDFELLISDNCSEDETEKYVRNIKDDRVVYTRPHDHCCMAKNWEHALTKARGDYILFLGDDDGLTKSALVRAEQIINKYAPKAITWNKAVYNWPDSGKNPGKAKIYFDTDMYTVVASWMIYMLAKGHTHYSYLPSVYNSFVHKTIIQKVKQSSCDGKYFGSNTPDVYSGIANAAKIKEYIYSERPFSISGSSKYSNGNAINVAGDLFKDFFDRNELPWNNRLPAIAGVIDSSIAEAYLQAFDRNLTKGIKLNFELYRRRIIHHVINIERSDHREWALKKLENFSLISHLEANSLVRKQEDNLQRARTAEDKKSDLDTIELETVLDCNESAINNVFDFMLLEHDMLEKKIENDIRLKSFAMFLLKRVRKLHRLKEFIHRSLFKK